MRFDKQVDKPVVFLGLPRYKPFEQATGLGLTPYEQCAAIFNHAGSTSVSVIGRPEIGSMLTRGFNRLLCSALNMRRTGVDFFAMLHEDVQPPLHWIDRLLNISWGHKADVVSVVSPMKDSRYLTSTGVRLGPGSIRRFSRKEIMKMPETFDVAQAGFPGKELVFNTGCWLFDLRKPWVTDPSVMTFNVTNEIEFKDGVYVESGLTEDWLFSLQAQERGAKCVATRSLIVNHGGWRLDDKEQEGEWETDMEGSF